MRRRQKYHAQKMAALEAASSSMDPAEWPAIAASEFTGGPLTYGTPASTVTEITPIIDPHRCPKCGRTVGRGKHLHLKHCKGTLA